MGVTLRAVAAPHHGGRPALRPRRLAPRRHRPRAPRGARRPVDL